MPDGYPGINVPAVRSVQKDQLSHSSLDVDRLKASTRVLFRSARCTALSLLYEVFAATYMKQLPRALLGCRNDHVFSDLYGACLPVGQGAADGGSMLARLKLP